MTRSARAVCERDIYLYNSRIWLAIYAIFEPRKGIMIHGDGRKEENEGDKMILGRSIVDQTRE